MSILLMCRMGFQPMLHIPHGQDGRATLKFSYFQTQ